MTKLIFGINVPYQSRRLVFDRLITSPLQYEPCIRTHPQMFFILCDICGSQVLPGRASRGLTTCCPACNKKKWDKINGLVIKREKAASGVRPVMFWWTISHECFTRDDKKCVKCGSTHKLECHHIKAIKDGGDNQLSNLITLCHDCHKKEHSHIANVKKKHHLLSNF